MLSPTPVTGLLIPNGAPPSGRSAIHIGGVMCEESFAQAPCPNAKRAAPLSWLRADPAALRKYRVSSHFAAERQDASSPRHFAAGSWPRYSPQCRVYHRH
jgi:hypothetical protein